MFIEHCRTLCRFGKTFSNSLIHLEYRDSFSEPVWSDSRPQTTAIMSYMMQHLHNGWQVDQAILSEEDRVVVIRFGHDWDPTCMKMDEVLYSIAEKVIHRFNLQNYLNLIVLLNSNMNSALWSQLIYWKDEDRRSWTVRYGFILCLVVSLVCSFHLTHKEFLLIPYYDL